MAYKWWLRTHLLTNWDDPPSSSFWYHLDIANVWVVIMTVGNYSKCLNTRNGSFLFLLMILKKCSFAGVSIHYVCVFNNRANSPWFHWIVSFLVGVKQHPLLGFQSGPPHKSSKRTVPWQNLLDLQEPKFLSVQIGVPKKFRLRQKMRGHQCQHKS